MNTEESIKQIKTLIEAWKLDEADLNQTDINAMQVLLKENQELREALEIKSYCKYANKCNEIYDCSREEYEDMANANMRLHVENQELKEKFKATNKGLQKVVLKRKKWKYGYQLARCEIKELKEKLDKYENPEDMTLFTMWCTEKVKDENEKLKKQLENKYEKVGTLTSELLYEENTKLINQQKEFTKYLEDEIKKEKKDLEHLCDLYKIPQKNNSTYKFVYSYINKIEKILQKYKEITQTKSDKSV